MDRIASKKKYIGKLKDDNGKKHAAGLKKKYAPATEAPDEEWAAAPESPDALTEPPLVSAPGAKEVDVTVGQPFDLQASNDIEDPDLIAALEASMPPEAEPAPLPATEEGGVDIGATAMAGPSGALAPEAADPSMFAKFRESIEALGFGPEDLEAILASLGEGQPALEEKHEDIDPVPEMATLLPDDEE